jgi:hypothetical protein
MHILNLNLSHCFIKRNIAKDAVKHAQESIKYNDSSAKAYYRLALAYKLNNELD